MILYLDRFKQKFWSHFSIGTKETSKVSYVLQRAEPRLIVVVDITPSQENMSYGGRSRLPSGCIIEDIAIDYSKVTSESYYFNPNFFECLEKLKLRNYQNFVTCLEI